MSCNFWTIDGYVVTVYQCLYMADVVAISLWLMLLPLFDVGRCYCHDHSMRSGHEVNIDNFSIVGREDQNLTRTIKEALYIRVNNLSLNKNIGKYHLPHIWDEVLCNSRELKLK